jgi:hypothetical protein
LAPFLEFETTPPYVNPSRNRRHYPAGRFAAETEKHGQRDILLSRPFLKPRRQLFQIDAIEADLVLVPAPLVRVEEPLVQLLGIVGGEVLVESLGEAVGLF